MFGGEKQGDKKIKGLLEDKKKPRQKKQNRGCHLPPEYGRRPRLKETQCLAH